MSDENMNSLEARVVALEAWKAEMLNHTISVMMTPPSKAERGQPIGYDQRPLDRQPEIPAPSDERLQEINEMRRADFRNGEASMNLVADAVKAAVAEYLRQVKEGGK